MLKVKLLNFEMTKSPIKAQFNVIFAIMRNDFSSFEHVKW